MQSDLAPTFPRAHTPTLFTWLIRFAYTSASMAVIFASLGVIGAAAFNLSYSDRIYPGVRALGIDLSGMTAAEAAVALSGAFTYPQSPAFTFHEGEHAWTATPAELGVALNLPATVNAAYAVGRSGNILSAWLDQFEAWYFGRQIAPVVTYDESHTLAYLKQLGEIFFQPTREASLVAEGAKVTATPGQIGRQLDVIATAAVLRASIMRLAPADIALQYVETPPLVLDASAQAAAAESILRQPLVLAVANPAPGDSTGWTIDQEALGAMLHIRRVEDGPNAAHFEVGLDAGALRAFLEPLAPPLERKAQDARFIFNDDTRQLEVIERAVDERRLDIEATIAAIHDSLAKDVHTVPLIFQTKPPQITDDMTAEQLGITGLVSEQSTYFAGSSAERINNIKVAGARFHGLLVPPNATFSFNEHLGDVSLDTGFAEALIIYGGRTIRGVGGGVCQVSTTLFRAAYFGGYPIVERNSHAYRVGYYERGDPGKWSGPGLDATVFAPLVDLKFQNDSPHWLLMEVYVSPTAGRITWKFYSTSDGRQVSVAPPVVENFVPHPDPLYEEDPELPAGTVKQVDYAADGADVTVYRTITRDGQQINAGEKPIRTHYQPWRAIYHYGPGTEGMPPPAPTPTPTP